MAATDEPTITRLTKTEWIAAMRRYPKARGVLRQLTQGDDPSVLIPTYCCLGMLACEEGAMGKALSEGSVLWMNQSDGDAEWHGWSGGHDEMYTQHPSLDNEVQAILIAMNDSSESFEDLVIPAIEALLNEDLSTQERHLEDGMVLITATKLGLMGAESPQIKEHQARKVMELLVKGLTLREILHDLKLQADSLPIP